MVSGPSADLALWLIVAATCTWLARMTHQHACEQTDVNNPVKTMLRLCYSDVPIVWNSNHLAGAGSVFPVQDGMAPLPLVGVLQQIARTLAKLLYTGGGTASDAQFNLLVGNNFVVMTGVVLFAFFLVLVLAHMLLGRESYLGLRDGQGRFLGRPVRSPDAIMVALSIGVLTCGMISWDLVSPALMATALVAWAMGRPLASGILTGVALGAGIVPLALVAAIIVLCLRAGRTDALLRYLVSTGIGLVAVLAVGIAMGGLAALRGYESLLVVNQGLGSIWWILAQFGIATSQTPMLAVLLVLVGGSVVVWLTLSAPVRPRLVEVACLFVLVAMVIAPTYSPQYVLWSLGLVALARPNWRDWLIFSAAEAIYWFMVWQFLQGNLRGDHGGLFYPGAILLRLGATAWIISRIVIDLRRPDADPVRVGGIDDPQGGVLDQAPDAGWMQPSGHR